MFRMSKSRKITVSKTVNLGVKVVGEEHRELLELVATNCYLHGYNARVGEESAARAKELEELMTGMERQYGQLEVVK
jgi:hemerythrin